MAKYRLVIALGVLAVLGGMAVVLIKKNAEETPAVESSAELPDLDKNEIDWLEVKRPGEQPVRFVKRGTEWRIIGPVDAKPDATAITTALERLDAFDVDVVVARSKATHASLEVDEAKGIRVTAKNGDKLLVDMIIGVQRDSGTMVRQAGKDAVVAVRGSLRYAFDKELKDWRDREVTDFDANQVTAVTWTSSKWTFSFAKTGDAWTIANASRIDRFEGTKVGDAIRGLARILAADFAPLGVGAGQAGIGEPSPTVTLTFAPSDGGTRPPLVMRLGLPDEDSRYLLVDGNEVVFKVSSSVAANIDVDVAHFQTPIPVDGGTPAPPAMPPMGMGGPGGMMGGPGGQEIPPEIMQQLQAQMAAQGGAPH